MEKMTNYFSHDSNARNDERLLNVRMQHGPAGYGVYFMIIERLRDSSNYMSVKDYNAIAFDLRADTKVIKSVVEDYGLFTFTEDGECFYSESLNRRMTKMVKVSEARSDAGRKGAAARWGTPKTGKSMADGSSTDGKRIANAKQMPSEKMPLKEKKIKEIKRKETKEKENKESTLPSGAESEVFAAYFENISAELSQTEISNLNIWIKDKRLPEDLIIVCIEEAARHNIKKFSYLKGIINNVLRDGITTAEQFKSRSKSKQVRVTRKETDEDKAVSDQILQHQFDQIKQLAKEDKASE